MTLRDVLTAALARHTQGGKPTGFARTGSSVWQYRTLGGVFTERRRYRGGWRLGNAAPSGWTSWSLSSSDFTIDDVLADDWILLADEEVTP